MLVKKERKKISDIEYQDAYKNQDNQRVIKSVLSKYRHKLDEHTLESCGLQALWKCLQSHDYSFTTKFTSSLWKFTTWECKREIAKVKNKSREQPLEFSADIAPDKQPVSYDLSDYFSLLSDDEKQVLNYRFVENMTLLEIGNRFGFTREAARLKIKKAINKIKDSVYNEIEE